MRVSFHLRNVQNSGQQRIQIKKCYPNRIAGKSVYKSGLFSFVHFKLTHIERKIYGYFYDRNTFLIAPLTISWTLTFGEPPFLAFWPACRRLDRPLSSGRTVHFYERPPTFTSTNPKIHYMLMRQ